MFENGIVVSLPGRQAATLRLSGSVFGAEELRDAVLPPELRVAIALVTEAASSRGLPLRFIARPEIFTHGVLTDHLTTRLGSTRDHIALSDGNAFRPLPGLRNHLFFYRRAVPEACREMRRLVEVAPELFETMASQVNSALAFRARGRWHRPRATMLDLAETPRTGPTELLPMLLNLSDPTGSASAALSENLDATAAESTAPSAGELRYVPLTESMLEDPAFMRLLADRLRSAMMRTEPLLVLQLPLVSIANGDIADQIAAVVRALEPTGIIFPRHAAISARWATGPLDAVQAEGAHILVHPGLDFWRFGRDLWRNAAEVELVQNGPAGAGFTRLFRAWLGEHPPLRLLSLRRAHDRVIVGSVL